MKSNGYRENTKRLDRLVELNLLPVDLDALLPELLSNIGSGDRSDETALLACAGGESH